MLDRYTNKSNNDNDMMRRLENANKSYARLQAQIEYLERKKNEIQKQIEDYEKQLGQQRKLAEQFSKGDSVDIEPGLSAKAPESFRSQMEQFSDTVANKRLRPIGGDSEPYTTGGEAERPAPRTNEPFFFTSDNDTHYESLYEDPGTTIYVSGYYYSSGMNSGEYEYVLSSSMLPIKIGDLIKAPIHIQGHLDGKMLKGWDRRFIITDIYTREKFTPYHDEIRNH